MLSYFFHHKRSKRITKDGTILKCYLTKVEKISEEERERITNERKEP